MTAGSSQQHLGQASMGSSRQQQQPAKAAACPAYTQQQQQQQQQQQLPSNVINCSSLAFQQIKQTQASLARLSRHVHFNSNSNNNQQQQQNLATSIQQTSSSSSSNAKPNPQTSFVDCLIRRFKNCFKEDFCEVPVFVVGNLSPGSDGTHLILPPCVSLGGQNISRFASAKNFRLLNSIRDSCRSIEQLDLCGNKLNDLIEIYKILQCMPNLKFLNLSENDLSRTAPVATSSSSTSSSSTTTHLWTPVSISFSSSSSTLASSNNPNHQRAYLSTINQNQAATAATNGGQVSSNQQRASLRVAEARRLAAVGATTTTRQKPTTTPSGARLTGPTAPSSSAAANNNSGQQASSSAPGSQHRLSTKSAASLGASSLARAPKGSLQLRNASSGLAGAKSGAISSSREHAPPVRTKSTMHLVRSLSSLSAKDVRVGARKASDLRDSTCPKSSLRHQNHRSASNMTRQQLRNHHLQSSAPSTAKSSTLANNNNAKLHATSNKATSLLGATSKLTRSAFSAEPISETLDGVDVVMGESCQVNEPNTTTTTVDCANNNGQQHATTKTGTTTSLNNNNNQQTGTPTTTTTISTPARSTSSVSITQQHNATACNNSMQFFQQQQQHPFRRTFESVKALALNNTGCQWRVVCSILSRMPNLEELHLSLNNYERIDLDPALEFRHTSLKRLYLCNNPKLTDFKELNKILIVFPSLDSLSIADCNISQIPENLAESREWRKICGLNINGWPIKEWPVIERLNELPSLIDLKCRNLELLNTIDEPRDHLIARLPNLQRLNGSEIEERDHAEKAFLRFFVTNSHLERPRRFHELIQIHGLVDAQVDVDVDLSPPSQANVRVIYLNKQYFSQNDQDDILMSEDFLNKLMATGDFYYDNSANQQQQLDSLDSQTDGDEQQQQQIVATITNNNSDDKPPMMRLFKDETQEIVALDIDLRQSVRKFKQIIANIFGLNSQNFILYYIDHEMVGLMGPELIKHNQKKLWNYNVQDGDQFIVEEL